MSENVHEVVDEGGAERGDASSHVGRLTALNLALLRFSGALTVLGEDGEEAKATCRGVLRRTLIAELLARRHMIAVAGTQGTGKTTLVRALYGLDSQWLRGTRGQGERMPIFLVEDDVDAPEGYLTSLVTDAAGARWEETPVGPDQWAAAMRQDDGDVLVLELRVPRLLFPQAPPRSSGLLLLPGYEPQDEMNQLWQELMRQALVGAARTLLVTHQQDLATDAPSAALVDLRDRYLAGTLPLVAITHCDPIAGDPTAQEKLRATAAGRYRRPAEGIFCVWPGDPGAPCYAELRAALVDLGYTAGAGDVRIRELERVVAGDLGNLVHRVERSFETYLDTTGSDSEREMRNLLRSFDTAVATMRDRFEHGLREELVKVRDTALRRALKLHQDRNEKWGRFWGRTVRRISLRPTTIHSAQEALILEAWTGGGDDSPVAEVLPRVLAAVVQRQYKAAGLETELTWSLPDAPAGEHGDRTEGAVIPLTALQRRAVDALAEVERLTQPAPVEDVDRRPGPELETAVRLLPALALDWARMGSVVPEFVGLVPGTLAPASDDAVTRTMEDLAGRLREWDRAQQGIVRAWASIAGLTRPVAGQSAAAAGSAGLADISTIRALATAARGGAGAAVGRAVTSVVVGSVAAATAVVTIDMINRGLRAKLSAAETAISEIYRMELDNRVAAYDELMGLAREILAGKLRRTYGLDEALARREWLRATLQSVQARRLDLLEAFHGHLGTLG
ncbi:hypothetical protein [Micromonospora narathiwatensis]|uniref:Uncharacterized protein n=1 Tax=Micromonospora narathiwatensis TaxID=299146 RepID=A0A1A8ZB46_9ACTN|nr:hypothetical protein [Micromonospora narathiwatensis]SBT41057.1 hypothetical protein GA0070621_1129 [Micromonospora narathiwatensis]